MAERITTCPKCNTTNFIITDDSGMNEPRTICIVKAKCNDCGDDFEYPTFTKIGLRKRSSGHIW
jgi:Zn finger protein HypA/HybF involved in hydrogenase expression